MIADSHLLQLSLANIFESLHCSKNGLNDNEARRRLLDIGANEPVPERLNGGLREILRGLANPLVLILLVAGLVSAMVGELVNASIIITMIILSLIIPLEISSGDAVFFALCS